MKNRRTYKLDNKKGNLVMPMS